MELENENIKEIINSLRHDFSKDTLDEKTARPNPFEQFGLWIGEALEKQLHEPNAMVLSTATPDAKPSSRVVLLRGFDEAGFTFFTNYESRKAVEIQANPHAALLFYWAQIEKQVRIEGEITKIDGKDSDAYFASRPRESRVGALASPQSRVIESRRALEEKFAELNEQMAGAEITRPRHWGGYVVKPEIFEFWQGRASRLHDRLRYVKNESGWRIERLAP